MRWSSNDNYFELSTFALCYHISTIVIIWLSNIRPIIIQYQMVLQSTIINVFFFFVVLRSHENRLFCFLFLFLFIFLFCLIYRSIEEQKLEANEKKTPLIWFDINRNSKGMKSSQQKLPRTKKAKSYKNPMKIVEKVQFLFGSSQRQYKMKFLTVTFLATILCAAVNPQL